MRKLLLAALLVPALGCQNKAPSGPGVVKITETTTTTSTVPVVTTTVAIPTEAKFTFSPVTPEELQVVNFNGSTSTGGQGEGETARRTIVSYSWDFGDGDKKTGETSTHDYVKTGVYLITLTVVDNKGISAASSQTITIRPATP
jgi:PKD repeat protein